MYCNQKSRRGNNTATAASPVTEGLSLIFAASSKGSPPLTTQLELSNSMGLLLLKTTITRDVAEDVGEAEGQYFWPREVWAGGGMAAGFGVDEVCVCV
ncbi:hypothetical protein DFH09DRAFT_1317150 [Mycena vulgaris]|nr:hypothetical protein DFH09DRAFT_1317150 [Mycena vulgaris]